MKKIFLFLLFIPLLAFNQEDKMLVDKIAGIVGDKIILFSDIELQFQQMQIEGEVKPEFRCQLFDQMLSQKMFLQQAILDSISVTEDEIESELDQRIRYFVRMIGSEQKLEEYYEKSIIEIKDEFRKDIEEQLLAKKMQSKVLENVKITPSEVKSFFNKIPEDSLPYFNADVEVGQIVIYPQVAKAQKQLAIEKIEGLRERLVSGEDFGTLALIYSEDPGSAEQGGDLGFIKRGEMVSEFEAAAFKLEENEISPVVETKFGYHLIQLLERKGEKIHVRHILIQPKITSFDLADAKEKLDSVKSLIDHDSLTFSSAVNQFSEDESTKHQGGMLINPQTGNNYFEIGQLDKATYFTIEKMIPGQISEPVLFQTDDGRQAYRLVYLKSESEAHVANLKDDFYRIKAAALAAKENGVLEDWISDKSKETYIYIDDSYKDCITLQKWLNKDDIIEKTYE